MPERAVGAELGWVQVLDGSTFMLSDSRGDVEEGSVAGLFHEDTRHLSRFLLTLGGERPELLSSGGVDHYSAAFFLTNPDLPGIPAGSLSLQRYRFLGPGLSEVLLIQSHLEKPVEVELRLSVAADFADLFEVKEMQLQKRGAFKVSREPKRSLLLFEYEHGDFRAGTRVHSTEPGRLAEQALVFKQVLEPASTWKTRIQISVRRGDELLEPVEEEEHGASRALQQWRRPSTVVQKWELEAPRVETDWTLLNLVYEKSVADLAALRLYADVGGNEFCLPAAGLPWFMAIFGRDTLITSYQSLLVGPELARGALNALAGLQGTEENDFKDEEPGKILHEIRFGELTVIGESPHAPYYGTVDATALFLILLSEYWLVTGDDQTVKKLHPNALLALDWIDRYGDRDGDGYVEYETRSDQGLPHQGWKDSAAPIRFADGKAAKPPIALCEVQGYVYDAKIRMAELAERVWRDAGLAERLRTGARELFDRFNSDFWIERQGGYYAEALDSKKRQVDSLTSNVGHLLWSGIVPEDRAGKLVKQLFSESLFSGWGVRTMSRDSAAYNPISYHNGTVWPHDNCVISAGLHRYGYREEANRIALAMLEAASHTEFRLPEVFAGYPRTDSRFPIRYPTASSPQAWATASPFLWLRLMLGVEIRDGEVLVDPLLPKECGRVHVRGLHALGRRYDVIAAGRTGEVRPAD